MVNHSKYAAVNNCASSAAAQNYAEKHQSRRRSIILSLKDRKPSRNLQLQPPQRRQSQLPSADHCRVETWEIETHFRPSSSPKILIQSSVFRLLSKAATARFSPIITFCLASSSHSCRFEPFTHAGCFFSRTQGVGKGNGSTQAAVNRLEIRRRHWRNVTFSHRNFFFLAANVCVECDIFGRVTASFIALTDAREDYVKGVIDVSSRVKTALFPMLKGVFDVITRNCCPRKRETPQLPLGRRDGVKCRLERNQRTF